MTALETETIPNVPILRTGAGFNGHGCPVDGCSFTAADLDNIVFAYYATRDALFVPVKLGHSTQSGQPAVGWVQNLRRVGDRLLADLVGVPKKVADLIKAGAYRQRSVELDQNMKVDGTTYPTILTGLALLGADLPAVPGLGDMMPLFFTHRHPGCCGGCGGCSFKVAGIQLTAEEIHIAGQMGVSEDELREFKNRRTE